MVRVSAPTPTDPGRRSECRRCSYPSTRPRVPGMAAALQTAHLQLRGADVQLRDAPAGPLFPRFPPPVQIVVPAGPAASQWPSSSLSCDPFRCRHCRFGLRAAPHMLITLDPECLHHPFFLVNEMDHHRERLSGADHRGPCFEPFQTAGYAALSPVPHSRAFSAVRAASPVLRPAPEH